MSSQPITRRAVWWITGATLAVLLLCSCGGLLAFRDADNENASTPASRPQAMATEIAVPVTSEPTPSESPEPEESATPTESASPLENASPSESAEPAESATPTPTVDADEAACIKRSERSAERVYFDEDYSDMCAYVPDHDFGVSVKDYDRCVKKSRKYHVEKDMYEVTCRYDHTYRWTETDDPNYTYTPEIPDSTDDPSLDDPRAGCTWVDSYFRKDGTYVRGHHRC